MNSKDEKTYVGGAAPGSEMGWIDDPLAYIRSDNLPATSESWVLEYFRYMVMPAAGLHWKLTDFDFDRDRRRFSTGVQESLLNAANPDPGYVAADYVVFDKLGHAIAPWPALACGINFAFTI